MNISVALTGKAGKKGHESLGFTDDPGLSMRLYTHAQRETQKASRLELSIRNIEGSLYSYYTYLISENVAETKTEDDERKGEKHGRTGSFIGVTVRIAGAYSKNISDIFQLLERLYSKYLYNSIITDTNTDGYLTYQIKELGEADEQLKSIEAEIKEYLEKQSFTFVDIPLDTICAITGQTSKFSTEDASSKPLYDALFNGSEIYISSLYTSLAEIEEKRNREIEEQKEVVEEHKSEDKDDLSPISVTPVTSSPIKEEPLSVEKNDLSVLQQTISEQTARIISLEKQHKNDEDRIAQLEEQLRQRISENKNRKANKAIPICAIVLLLLGFCLWTELKPNPVNDDVGKELTNDSLEEDTVGTSKDEEQDSLNQRRFTEITKVFNLRKCDAQFSPTGRQSEIGVKVEVIDTINRDAHGANKWGKIVYNNDTVMIAFSGLKECE